MVDIYYMYKISNTVTSRCYIGITKNYNKRFKEHRYRSSNQDLREDINSIGVDNFHFEVICIGKKDFIVELEHSYLKKHIIHNMYNKNTGGSSNGGTYGEFHGASRLNNLEVIEIRELYGTGRYTYESLGKLYGITASTIGKIIRADNWQELAEVDAYKAPTTSYPPDRDYTTRDKINYQLAEDMRALYSRGGYTYKDIAERYNNIISATAVGKIIRNERWKSV